MAKGKRRIFTNFEIKNIKRDLENGMSQIDVAQKYKTNYLSIHRIKIGETHSNISSNQCLEQVTFSVKILTAKLPPLEKLLLMYMIHRLKYRDWQFSMTDASKVLCISKQSLTKHMNALIDKGLVERSRSMKNHVWNWKFKLLQEGINKLQEETED